MRQFLIILMLLIATFVIFGCGDDKPTEPDVPKAQRILVTAAASAPPLNTTESAVWDAITPTTVGLSTLLSPAPVSAGITAIADSVHVQALTFHDTLYMRIVWTDNTHDVWRDAYYVTNDSVPLDGKFATYFDLSAGVWEEDQLWVLFSGLSNGDWDGLNWRSLTTDSAFLAEGINVHNDSVLVPDAGDLMVTDTNYLLYDHSYPGYFHEDTSAFTGYCLFKGGNLRTFDLFIRGWDINQKVSRYLIDSTVRNKSVVERGSRWDTRTVAHWDALRAPSPIYTVVMCRPLSTGFIDDVVLADSVMTKIGVFDNLVVFNQKGSGRAFTSGFWLIFQ